MKIYYLQLEGSVCDLIDPGVNFWRLKVSPDMKRVALFAGTSNLHFLDADSLPVLAIHDAGIRANELAFSPNSDLFATHFSGRIRIFDFNGGEYQFNADLYPGVYDLDWSFGRDPELTPVMSISYPLADASEVSLYPNPASESVYFDREIDRVTIFNVSGVLAYDSLQHTSEIKVTSLPPGLYLCRILAGDMIQYSKVVVSREF
jgi:WD40 repeat protein